MDYLNFDLEKLEEELRSDSARLFQEQHESYVQIIEPGRPAFCLDGTESLVQYLEKPITGPGVRIISLPQQGSVGKLGTSYAGFGALLRSLGTFPPVLAMVRAFGTKVNHDANPTPPYQEHFDESRDIYYCSFVVRHAEEHGRPNAVDPWSVRQMGVFISSDLKNDQHTAVLINPVKRISKRFRKLSEQVQPTTGDLLSIVFSTTLQKWPAYLDHLERSCNQLQTRTAVDTFNVSANSPIGVLSMVDLEHLQQTRSSLRLASRAMGTVKQALNALQRGYTSHFPMHSPGSMVTHLSNELERAMMLSMSLAETAELVRTVLERQQSNKASEMTRLAAVDTSVMLELGRKARRDSVTLKVIAMLTLIYLPASFVSTVLDMGYVHINEKEPHHLQFDREFLIFIVLTVIFLCITLCIWWGFELRARRQIQSTLSHETDVDEKRCQEV